VGATRTLYKHQEFNFAGPFGDNGWLEDYTAQVRDEPIGCVVLVTRNAAGEAQHIAANYRSRSSLLLLSRLVGEKFADTPYAKYFLASESLNGRTRDCCFPCKAELLLFVQSTSPKLGSGDAQAVDRYPAGCSGITPSCCMKLS
jgi:hypothetical protein